MSLLEAIRARTAPLHVELETVLNVTEQVRTRDQYAGLLARFTALYGPWEGRLAAFSENFQRTGLDLGTRLRVPNLQKDLAVLDAHVRLPAAPEAAPSFENFGEALGSLYVLEGSTLGGQVLTRHFREDLAIPPDALHFFASHGPQVGKMWKDFCAVLNVYGEKADATVRADVVRGAEKSFHALIAWFQKYPVN